MLNEIELVVQKPTEPQHVPLSHLDQVPLGSMMKIKAGKTMDSVPEAHRHDALKTVVGKLRYNGEMSMEGTDIHGLGRMLYTASLNSKEASEVLYGQVNQSVSSVSETIEFLTSLGLTIIQKQVDGYKYFIQAKRIAH